LGHLAFFFASGRFVFAMSLHEYNGLRGTVEDAQRRAQALGTAFEEHIDRIGAKGKVPSRNPAIG